jgi:hypothetical protein
VGYCREVPPCGQGREYRYLHWEPMCVTPLIEDNCGKNETYSTETNECLFNNQCPEGEWNFDGMCMTTSCHVLSTDLVQNDAFYSCYCPENTHWDDTELTCVENDVCNELQYYHWRAHEC